MKVNIFNVKRSTAILTLLFITTFFLYAIGSDMFANMIFLIDIIVLLYEGWKSPELLAVALIIIETRMFGTGPDKIFGILPEKLEIIILIIAYFFWSIRKFSNRKKIPHSYILLGYTGAVIIVAAVMGYITIGQSILFGIFLQTRLLVVLVVFPISAMMMNKHNSFQRLWNWIKIMALVQSIINIIQFLIYPKIEFLTITSENIRFGSIRITYGYMLITVALFMAYSEFLNNLNIRNGIYCLIYLVDILFVCKTRMLIFGIVVALIIVSLRILKYKSQWKKILLLGLICIILVNVMSNRIYELINLTKQEVTENSGNYIARTEEIDFYTKQVKNPIVGRGYISPKSKGGEALDTKYGYFSLSDIGLVGLYTISGIVGILWFVIVLLLLFINLNNEDNKTYYLLYAIFSIAVCTTLLTVYYTSEYLAITFILLVGSSKKAKLDTKET